MKANKIVAVMMLAGVLGLIGCGQDAPVEFGSEGSSVEAKNASSGSSSDVSEVADAKIAGYVNSASVLYSGKKIAGYILLGYDKADLAKSSKSDCKLATEAACIKLLESKLIAWCNSLGFKQVVAFAAPLDAGKYIAQKGLTSPGVSAQELKAGLPEFYLTNGSTLIATDIYGAACH